MSSICLPTVAISTGVLAELLLDRGLVRVGLLQREVQLVETALLVSATVCSFFAELDEPSARDASKS